MATSLQQALSKEQMSARIFLGRNNAPLAMLTQKWQPLRGKFADVIIKDKLKQGTLFFNLEIGRVARTEGHKGLMQWKNNKRHVPERDLGDMGLEV